MSSETRTRILEAAQRLLETRGAAATRLVDVAKAAGVSRQAVYLHHGSRGGLLVALVNHMDATSSLVEDLAWVMAAPTGVEALRRNQMITAKHSERVHAVAMALLKERDQDEAAAAALEDRLRARLDGLRAIIGRVEAEGALADGWQAERAAEAVWAMGLPTMWQALGVERGWSVEAFGRFLVDAAMRLVVVQG